MRYTESALAHDLDLFDGTLSRSESMAELAIRRTMTQTYVSKHMTSAPTFVTTDTNEAGAPREVTWRGFAFRVEVRSVFGCGQNCWTQTLNGVFVLRRLVVALA